MRTILMTLLIGMVFPSIASSQTFFAGHINENLLKGRVKQIEEFMARFNYEEDWEGQKVEANTDTIMRAKYLHTLFDLSTFGREKGRLSPIAERFIHDVISNNYTIHYADSAWVAKLRCKAVVCGKPSSVTLYLQIENVAPNEYVWVITNVDGPLFSEPSTSGPSPFISPVEHEVGFIGLLSLKTGKNYDLSRLFPKEKSPDRLSMLYMLMKNNLISITSIENVSYHFFNIPDYAFVVERVERKNSYNTGWLITQLNTMK